ncbi:MAG: class I SAM-dependent methyltransferase [Promethearchaeota archaeon]
MDRKSRRKKLAPEYFYESPDEYFSGETLQNYLHSKSMMRIQEKITKRALEIVGAKGDIFPSLVLDVGMGCGFSTSYLYLKNFHVIGVDLIYDMLAEYDIRELNPINTDMNYLPFRTNTFKYIFSISTFQWIFNKKDLGERNNIIKNIAECFNSLLKPKGKVVIQFYPSTNNLSEEQELLKEIGIIFADSGDFSGNFIIDNPNLGVKRKIFLYLKKN